MCAVDVDGALPMVNSSQFSMMTANRRDLSMPLYTAPSAVFVVTSVVPTAVHTSSLFSSGAYTQAPAGAFITHTSRGPAVAFPIGAYPEWGNAAIPVGYSNPAPALPTSVMDGPMVSMVDPASTLFGTLPTVSSLPTDTTFTTTTVVTSAVNSVSSELAPGLKFLALAPRPPGVATYPDGQALPVPAAATPAVPPPMAITPAAAQQQGSATAVHTAASTSTATTAAPVVPPESTTTSSAVPTTSPPADAVSTALPVSTATSSVVIAPPPSTSTVASSSSSTGVAVVVSSGSDPPGSTYIASTQSAPHQLLLCTVRMC